ncbi:MAG: DUF971 domain-containing protein [Nevskiaceae bacterium]|nr:MAG: DUF971 domain-containing protein [Nevskiaceae bacterium]TBR73192.1 MAG: DUF971 domain-containing protein [Nevskiaceae bacterium]
MPKVIRAHRVSRVLELVYTDGTRHELPFEFLRVYSPSAEVRGHGGGEPMPVPGKRNVGIERVETVGRYAVRLVFDDGHDSGLYTWDILDDLGAHQSEYWTYYLERLEKGGMSRDSGVVTLAALGPGKHHPAR